MKILQMVAVLTALLFLASTEAQAARCTSGQPCGNSCISWNDTCHIGGSGGGGGGGNEPDVLVIVLAVVGVATVGGLSLWLYHARPWENKKAVAAEITPEPPHPCTTDEDCAGYTEYRCSFRHCWPKAALPKLKGIGASCQYDDDCASRLCYLYQCTKRDESHTLTPATPRPMLAVGVSLDGLAVTGNWVF